MKNMLVLAPAIAMIPWANAAWAADPGLVINEDNSHFYGSRTAEDMTLEGLRAFVDQYAGTRATALFLCPNAMRASYGSEVWDRIWDIGGQKIPGEPFAEAWPVNAKLLFERGLDPYAVWIARCREKGVSPWLTMRMNDVHNVDDTTNFMHNTFWLEHPEYWRVPGSTGSWVDRAYDYGIPEVREHHMKLIREMLERYDPDGLELDWMRFGYHFKPGHEAEGSEILTAFMGEVRRLAGDGAGKRGHPIRISARVPAHPDAAVGLGMDGVRWAKEGLVDMLVPTPFWATTDFDIPLELWRERLGDAAGKIVLAAGCEVLVRAYPGAEAVTHDLDTARGFAASAWQRGADRIYLFNFMDPAPIQGGVEAYRALLEEGLGPEVVDAKPRRHPVTYRDTVPPGMSNNAQLPLEGRAGTPLRIHIGPAPKTGVAHIVAGLAKRDGVETATFAVTLNGTGCPSAPDLDNPGPFPGAARAVCFACPLEALRDGYNEIALAQTPGQSDQAIVWAELRFAAAAK